MKKFLLLLFALSFFAISADAGAAGLAVTDISVSSNTMSVTLNKQLELKGITVTENQLTLPQDIELLSRELEGQLLTAYQTGAPPSTPPSSVSFKITGIDATNGSPRATVIFNDALSATCLILASEKGPWLSWPEGFGILNNAFKKMIERTVLKNYEESSK